MADSSNVPHPSHLSPSELGTKEYWETFYSRTLTHISSKSDRDNAVTSASSAAEAADNDISDNESEASYNADSDPGTSWFSEHNAPQKVLSFLTRDTFPLAPCNTLPATPRGRRKAGRPLSADGKAGQPSILDLGTGNGSMLALLRKRGGFRGTMVGVDYSEKSVELARELQRSRRHEAYLSDSDDEDDEEEYYGSADEGEGNQPADADAEEEWEEIRFEEWDILNSSADLASEKLDWFPHGKGGFDIVLDKGTFDAVSLMAEKSECERYPGIAAQLARKGGFLVVTSCNWTEEELVRWFTAPTTTGAGNSEKTAKLVVWGTVQYPRFRFGGQEGQGVCTVCFQRV
ncbi:methyltransferase domain-containing protein [Aspergillus insuetus]